MQKRISLLILIFIILTNFVNIILADDYNEYLEEIEKILNVEVQASGSIGNEPTINARHSIILERGTKKVLYGKCEEERCKMASTTKIMTAIVVIENCKDIGKYTTISRKAATTSGSRLGLSTNNKITIKDLLYGLMLVSGNDAAIALSEAIGGTTENFVNMMNKKALELELKNTHFVTPHGLDEENHYTTAYELAILADYALNNEIFSKIVKTTNYTVRIDNKTKELKNTNELLGYLEGIYGVKTGFTNGANRCLVTSCKRKNLDIICVVLGCDTKKDRTIDSINLINYAFNNFSKVNIKEIIYGNFEKWKLKYRNSFFINKGINSKIDLYLDESQLPYEEVAIKNESINDILISISAEFQHEAPLEKNTKIGTIDIKIDKNNFFSIDILNKNTIKRKDIINYLEKFVKNYHTYFKNIDNIFKKE